MSISEQIKCAERELQIRRRVYPAWVTKGRMTEVQAAEEIAAMAAIVGTLRAKQDEELAR